MSQQHATPMLFLAVKALPKNALIEKQVLYHTGRAFSVSDASDCDSEEGDSTPVTCPPIYGTGIGYRSVPSSGSHLIRIRRRNVCRRRH